MSQDAKNPLAGVSEKREKLEQWLAIRKEAGLQIDPLTAEVCWEYGQTLDPYGIDPPPAEYDQLQRNYFARSPGSDIWVHFDDLPDATSDALWDRYRSKLGFPAGLEEIFAAGKDDENH